MAGNDFVVIDVEGDLWDYGAINSEVDSIADAFLRQFYRGMSGQTSRGALMEFHNMIADRGRVVGDSYPLKTALMRVGMLYSDEWSHAEGAALYDEENATIVREEDRAPISPKISNHPYVKITPTDPAHEDQHYIDRFDRLLVSLRGNFHVRVRFPQDTVGEKMKALRDRYEQYADRIGSILGKFYPNSLPSAEIIFPAHAQGRGPVKLRMETEAAHRRAWRE